MLANIDSAVEAAGRSSQRMCCVRKGVLRNFTKFTGKHLCSSLFFNKVAGLSLQPATLLKKRLWHRCFPVYFANFFTEHLRATTSELSLLKDSYKKALS